MVWNLRSTYHFNIVRICLIVRTVVRTFGKVSHLRIFLNYYFILDWTSFVERYKKMFSVGTDDVHYFLGTISRDVPMQEVSRTQRVFVVYMLRYPIALIMN